VWHWDSGPFGAIAPDEDPDVDGHKVTLNLHFPGRFQAFFPAAGPSGQFP
jgi:hypothetical protein